MPTRDTAPIGAPCWVDLASSDVERSRAFYCELFGWGAEEPAPEFGGYFNFTRNGIRVAGGMAAQPGMGLQDVWTVYLATDDARKTLEAAVANGGTVHVDAMEVGDLGTMAAVTDAGGAFVGIWQPNTYQGFGVLAETGAPAWFELHTRDYERSIAFYRDVFHWDTATLSDTEEMRYTTLGSGDGAMAGIFDATAFLPEGVPAHWSVYFGVDDTDAALAKIEQLGGTTVEAAMDTPYGRLAAATDPLGARFKLVAPNEQMPAK